MLQLYVYILTPQSLSQQDLLHTHNLSTQTKTAQTTAVYKTSCS